MINDLPVTVDRYSWASQLGVVPWEFPIPKLALARRFSAGSVAIYLLVVPMTRVLILMRHIATTLQCTLFKVRAPRFRDVVIKWNRF